MSVWSWLTDSVLRAEAELRLPPPPGLPVSERATVPVCPEVDEHRRDEGLEVLEDERAEREREWADGPLGGW